MNLKTKTRRLARMAAAGLTVMLSAASGVYICAMAANSGSSGYATASNASTGISATGNVGAENASSSNAALPGAGVLVQQTLYTVDSYDFWYAYWPLSVELGAKFDSDAELPDTVGVYLEGPEGLLDDSIELAVEWNLDGVDFDREGSYTVTGILDTTSCEYPADWKHAPALSFTLTIEQGGTLSFTAEPDGDTLTLFYEMNGELFQTSYTGFDLYESRDGGASWQNITRSTRVCINENILRISGVDTDRLFQITELRLGGFYSHYSDLVQVRADGGIGQVQILPSGGKQGGDRWSQATGSVWDPAYVMDGPYPILAYRSGLRPYPSLDVRVLPGEQGEIPWQFYNPISILYGDRPGGVWTDRVIVPVEWDSAELKAIDWEREGNTPVHGKFSSETQKEYGNLLDFTSMPKPVLNVTVYIARNSFGLQAIGDILHENNRLDLQFFHDPNGTNIPLSFDGTAGLKVWCSVDGNETWYDITDDPDIALTGASLSASYLKDEYLNGLGYTFQLEQTANSGLERFSASLNVSRGEENKLYFGWDVGGDRGGGKRYGKPPFDVFSGSAGNDGTGGDKTSAPEPTPPGEETDGSSGGYIEAGSPSVWAPGGLQDADDSEGIPASPPKLQAASPDEAAVTDVAATVTETTDMPAPAAAQAGTISTGYAPAKTVPAEAALAETTLAEAALTESGQVFPVSRSIPRFLPGAAAVCIGIYMGIRMTRR